MKLTKDEKKLVDYARKQLLKYTKQRKAKGLWDTMYAFVLSDSGKVYNGSCFECPNLVQTNICSEAHAIANMVLAETEKARVRCILVADPVPKVSDKCIVPCGRCRVVIYEYGTDKTTVLGADYIRTNKGWDIFSKIDKYQIKDLYPHPYEPKEWPE